MDSSASDNTELSAEGELGPAPLAEGGGAVPGRIASLDFIRGVAVLGILASNIAGYALASVEVSWPSAFHTLSDGEKYVWLAEFILVDGKMRSLFALLFGAGLVLFIDRAEEKGGFGEGLQFRRLFWLFLFGLAHFFFLFRGDILMAYALWGMGAMFAVNAPPALLFSLGGALFLARVPVFALEYSGMLGHGSFGPPPYSLDPVALRADGLRDIAQMGSGSLFEIIHYKADRFFLSALSDAGMAIFDSFAMMLIGIACFRLGLFERGVGSRAVRLWGWGLTLAGLAIGLPLAMTLLESGFALPQVRFYGSALAPLQRLPMTFGMLFLLLGYLPQLSRGWLGERMVAAGRMAFSNYIGTSLAMAIAFQGWGLGLYGRLDRVELFGFVLGGWVLMLAWSKPWLSRFRFGPLEWVWRCLTYGERVRMLR